MDSKPGSASPTLLKTELSRYPELKSSFSGYSWVLDESNDHWRYEHKHELQQLHSKCNL